ncbi:MAG TPA: lytic transglycosylase domain-containing protein [Terriglobales bacterium]|nr:lytic transglycosylase domain-containing protein [Terriglobales bacterium]
MRHSLQLGLILLLLAVSAAAGDRAVLRNGFTIDHDRREVMGDTTRLYTAGGYVDVPTVEIVSFEHLDTPPAPELAPTKTLHDHVADAGKTTGIDPDFIDSVIRQESGFNPNAVSRKGARGLMQLMPDTAEKLGVRNSFDPAQNIQGGAAYLRQLLELYHGDAQKALAAYNAGPGRVQQYKGVPPYRETQAYVARIIREYNRKKLAEQAAAKKTLNAQKKSVPKKSTPKKLAPTEAKRSTSAQPGS